MAEKKEKQVTFEESLNTSETFFLKNRKMIFGILGAVIVLVVGGILYHSYVSLPARTRRAPSWLRASS